MRGANLRLQSMLGKRAGDATSRIIGKCIVIQMLKLATAAFRKVTAWRHAVARPVGDRPVRKERVARNSEGHMLAACTDAIAAGGDPDDGIAAHRLARANGIAAIRSSAIIDAPARSAARP